MRLLVLYASHAHCRVSQAAARPSHIKEIAYGIGKQFASMHVLVLDLHPASNADVAKQSNAGINSRATTPDATPRDTLQSHWYANAGRLSTLWPLLKSTTRPRREELVVLVKPTTAMQMRQLNTVQVLHVPTTAIIIKRPAAQN
ncbi:hypothetical protein EV127DRAFT_480126 [Xylaria flabelliformis]|nr:hypothetical protein EV127DRAFT_480126 [Xylaria flabelliformis]